jgi:hypothetical protein
MVEVHEDIYGVAPWPWMLAKELVEEMEVERYVDTERLEAAVAASEKAAAQWELDAYGRTVSSQASSRRAGAKKDGSVRDSAVVKREAPKSSAQGIAKETLHVSTEGPQEAPGAASLQQPNVVSPVESVTRKRKLSKTPSLPEENDGVRSEVPGVSSITSAPASGEPPVRRKLAKTTLRPRTDEGRDAACARELERPLAVPVDAPRNRPTQSKRLGAAGGTELEQPQAAPVKPPRIRPTRAKRLGAACAKEPEQPLAAPVGPPKTRPTRSKRLEALLAMGKRERQLYVSQLTDRQQMALTMQLSLCEGGA